MLNRVTSEIAAPKSVNDDCRESVQDCGKLREKIITYESPFSYLTVIPSPKGFRGDEATARAENCGGPRPVTSYHTHHRSHDMTKNLSALDDLKTPSGRQILAIVAISIERT